MDTERNLLFGVVALQNGAVDADGLAETCAAWESEPTLPLADVMVDRGFMTVEQRTQIEETVARELASHGDDAGATLAATIDGRSLEALGGVVAASAAGGPASSAPDRCRRWRSPRSRRSPAPGRGRGGTSCWVGSHPARPTPATDTRSPTSTPRGAWAASGSPATARSAARSR